MISYLDIEIQSNSAEIKENFREYSLLSNFFFTYFLFFLGGVRHFLHHEISISPGFHLPPKNHGGSFRGRGSAGGFLTTCGGTSSHVTVTFPLIPIFREITQGKPTFLGITLPRENDGKIWV